MFPPPRSGDVPSIPFTSDAASGDAYRLASATASSIATAGGTSAVAQLAHRQPQHVSLEHGHPVGRPARAAAASISASSSLAPIPRALGLRAG